MLLVSLAWDGALLTENINFSLNYERTVGEWVSDHPLVSVGK